MNQPSTKRRIRLLLVSALSAFAVLGPIQVSDAANATVNITEADPENAASWTFDPPEVTVTPGSTVTWNHRGRQQHSVSSDTGAFDSGVMGPGKTWAHKFDAPGEYPYTCTPHPYMTGKVIVR